MDGTPVPYDFNHRVLDQVAHRPWPMPDGPWIMTQSWHDLLFAHWPLDPADIAPHIPKPLTLDTFNGIAYIAVVPFMMRNVSPRGVPALKWLNEFPEINVRTYVRLGDKPGVFFFSLDATNPLAVRTARTLFHLPYFKAAIDVEPRYHSRRTDARSPNGAAEFLGAFRPVGPVFEARPGTLEYFLTERYCLYALDGHQRAYICEIHHPPWPLQLAAADIQINTMLDGLRLRLSSSSIAPPLLHFAKRQDTIAWRPTRMDAP
jgi:uncharacterized protein YqjF (DUF2071 family)